MSAPRSGLPPAAAFWTSFLDQLPQTAEKVDEVIALLHVQSAILVNWLAKESDKIDKVDKDLAEVKVDLAEVKVEIRTVRVRPARVPALVNCAHDLSFMCLLE